MRELQHGRQAARIAINMGSMPDWLQEAGALHADSMVVDGHADTPQRFADEGWQWTSPELGGGQLSYASARAGELHGEFFALWAEPTHWAGKHVERTLALLGAVEDQAAKYPESLRLCTTAGEVCKAKAAGAFAALLGVEGGHSIASDLDLLRHLHAHGVRYMTLTWNNANDWCDSSGDIPRHGGLNSFGREVIAEMNRMGMLVDVSHVSDAAFWQAVEVSRAPIIASHSAARALTHAPRNLTNHMLRAVAATGGVVMVNFYAAFVSEPFRLAWNILQPEREAAERAATEHAHRAGKTVTYAAELQIARSFHPRIPRPPLSALLNHIEHILRVCGTSHVGFGSDFDGTPLAPEGIDSAADLLKITASLLQRGWQPSQLRGLLGENVLRVLDRARA